MLNPTTRRLLIKKFKKFGFIGPISGGKHEFMKKGVLKVSIPSPHKKEDVIGAPLLKEILKQAGISQEDWNKI
jgi:predicted RNA binding protein YcfA (HicA-like mRNA interferase family)